MVEHPVVLWPNICDNLRQILLTICQLFVKIYMNRIGFDRWTPTTTTGLTFHPSFCRTCICRTCKLECPGGVNAIIIEALPQIDIGGEFKKWGKILLKQGIFPFSVENINHFLCLEKLEHPYKSRIRHQYHIKCACLLHEQGKRCEISWPNDLRRSAFLSQHSQDLSKRPTLNRTFVQAGEQATRWQEYVLLIGMVPLQQVEKRGERFLLLGRGSPQRLERKAFQQAPVT